MRRLRSNVSLKVCEIGPHLTLTLALEAVGVGGVGDANHRLALIDAKPMGFARLSRCLVAFRVNIRGTNPLHVVGAGLSVPAYHP